MTSAAEAAAAKGLFAAELAAGLNTLDLNETVVFAQYARALIPLDGSIFWIGTGINKTIQGSLHWAVNKLQNKDDTFGQVSVTLTALSQVVDLESIAPGFALIATLPNGAMYAFSAQANYYKTADAWHYTGTAIPPALRSNVIPYTVGGGSLDTVTPVVNNSLPLWLALNSYTPHYPGRTTGGLTLYPSFLVVDNILPPYGVVHIEPSSTSSYTAVPQISSTGDLSQMCRDDVEITLYGARSDFVFNFVQTILQYATDTGNLGLLNMPTIHDEKRTHPELTILAQKKTIKFEVSYLMDTANFVANTLFQKIITSYHPTF
jgi:hypothetical protein